MSGYRSHHATIFLTSPAAGPIEVIRRKWDPDMARCIAAHVTLVYPEEAPVVELLSERIQEACGHTTTFRMRLGGVACFERPEAGVYLDVEDLDGGYRRMRDEVLRLTFRDLQVSPHVTLIHPRTSCRGREFWDTDRSVPQGEEFTVVRIAMTAFDGEKWDVIDTCPLEARERDGSAR